MDTSSTSSNAIRGTQSQDRLKERPSRFKKYRLGMMILGGAIAVSAAQYLWQPLADQSINAKKLRLATVQQGTFVRDFNAVGQLVATQAPSLYSSAEGHIHFIRQPGEPVTQGDLLATISSPKLQNEWELAITQLKELTLQQERSQLELRRQLLSLKKASDLAKINWKTAQREWQRAQQGFDKGVISDLDKSEAKDKLETALLNKNNAKSEAELQKDILTFEQKSAEQALAAQQLRVNELKRRVDSLNLRAPLTGQLGNWLVPQDSQISTQQALITVIDLSALEGELNIPQIQADDLSVGMKVDISVGNQPLQGKIRFISPEVKDGNVQVRVLLAKQGKDLRQNQRLRARIVLEEKPNTLQVPRGEFVRAGSSVYLVDGEQAVLKNVALGSRSINHVEILSGVNEGDKIIISDVAEFNQSPRVRLRF